MFDFEFDDFEDPADEERLNNLVASYEASDDSTYFDSDALEDIASYYFERGDFARALEVIDRLVAAQPYSSDAWMRRGILLNTLGRHEEAIQAYDQALV
ncbi:MAG TPA: tetratricopeptide repeat protein, partial [Rhodothermales bacterium]